MKLIHLREATDWGFRGGLRRLCMQQTSKKTNQSRHKNDCNRETLKPGLQRNQMSPTIYRLVGYTVHTLLTTCKNIVRNGNYVQNHIKININIDIILL